ncbi:MAG: Fur family transcriptional regulator [Oscillospiraceae bacterium]
MERERRYSKKRQAIYDCICSTKSHPSADWVYSRLKPEHPELSLGTVYRNIALFKEEGTVVSVASVNGTERLDGNTDPHAHFICFECGAVNDVEAGLEEELDKRLAEKTGAHVIRHELTFKGICPDCMKKRIT